MRGTEKEGIPAPIEEIMSHWTDIFKYREVYEEPEPELKPKPDLPKPDDSWDRGDPYRITVWYNEYEYAELMVTCHAVDSVGALHLVKTRTFISFHRKYCHYTDMAYWETKYHDAVYELDVTYAPGEWKAVERRIENDL